MTTEQKGYVDALGYSQDERRRLQEKIEDLQKENRALRAQLEASQQAIKNIKAHSEDGVLNGLDYADFLHAKAVKSQVMGLLFKAYSVLDTIHDESDSVGSLKVYYAGSERGMWAVEAASQLRAEMSILIHCPPFDNPDAACPVHNGLALHKCREYGY